MKTGYPLFIGVAAAVSLTCLAQAGQRDPADGKVLAPLVQRGDSKAVRPVPDFVALDREGKEVRLSDFRGKVVVVDLWATWCGPCIRGLPRLEALHRQTKGQDVVVLALNVGDNRENYDAWLKKNPKYTVPFLYDPAGESQPGIRGQYGVLGIPVTFVVDRAGNLVGKAGGNPDDMGSGDKTLAWDGTLGKIDPRLMELLKRVGVSARR